MGGCISSGPVKFMPVACLVLACTSGRELARPGSALEARWQLGRDRERRVVATSIYRDLLSRSLFARCRMVPTDSHYFDARARRCGGLSAAIDGAARLYLESAATPRFLRPLRLDGRLRWLDLPGLACE
jgi:hypothetical protein